MNKVLKEISRYIISIIMIMLILLSAVSLFTKTILLNENYYIKNFESETYISRVMSELKEDLQIFALGNAVPYEIFQDNLSETLVKDKIDSNISSSLSFLKSDNENFKSGWNSDNLNKYKENLAKDIKEYYPSAKDSEVESVTEESVKIIESYGTIFDFSKVSSFKDFKTAKKFLNISDKVYFSPILLVLIFLFLFRARGDVLRERLLWAGSAMIAAAVILIVPSAMLFAFKIPYRLAIGIEHINYAVKTLLISFGDFFLIFGIALGILGIMGILSYKYVEI